MYLTLSLSDSVSQNPRYLAGNEEEEEEEEEEGGGGGGGGGEKEEEEEEEEESDADGLPVFEVTNRQTPAVNVASQSDLALD